MGDLTKHAYVRYSEPPPSASVRGGQRFGQLYRRRAAGAQPGPARLAPPGHPDRRADSSRLGPAGALGEPSGCMPRLPLTRQDGQRGLSGALDIAAGPVTGWWPAPRHGDRRAGSMGGVVGGPSGPSRRTPHQNVVNQSLPRAQRLQNISEQASPAQAATLDELPVALAAARRRDQLYRAVRPVVSPV